MGGSHDNNEYDDDTRLRKAITAYSHTHSA